RGRRAPCEVATSRSYPNGQDREVGPDQFFTYHVLVNGSSVKNLCSISATFFLPLGLGWVPSLAARSLCSQTRPSLLRGLVPSAQRYGPQSRSGAFTAPFAGS